MSQNDIQAPEDASPESQSILDELEAEGHQIEGREPKEPEKKEEEPTEEKPKGDESEEPKPKPDEEKPEDKEESEEQEETEEEPQKQPQKRAAKYVPVKKHNEERHKRQEAERRAEEAERAAAELREQLEGADDKPSKQNLDEVKEAATKLAEKHGLEKEFVEEFAETIVGIAEKRNVLPSEISEKLASLEAAKAEAEAEKAELQQEKYFEDEFTDLVKGFGQDTKEGAYLAERKEELKQLAFSEGNVNTTLRRIALEYLHDNPPPEPGKKSAEEPYAGKKHGESKVIDFVDITDEDFAKMSYDEIEEYEAWRAKNGVK